MVTYDIGIPSQSTLKKASENICLQHFPIPASFVFFCFNSFNDIFFKLIFFLIFLDYFDKIIF